MTEDGVTTNSMREQPHSKPRIHRDTVWTPQTPGDQRRAAFTFHTKSWQTGFVAGRIWGWQCNWKLECSLSEASKYSQQSNAPQMGVMICYSIAVRHELLHERSLAGFDTEPSLVPMPNSCSIESSLAQGQIGILKPNLRALHR